LDQALLPVDHPAHRAAEAEADLLRERPVTLREMQALASGLDGRPQLGCDVFVRGLPGLVGTSIETAHISRYGLAKEGPECGPRSSSALPCRTKWPTPGHGQSRLV
jgi:hypothetical protein